MIPLMKTIIPAIPGFGRSDVPRPTSWAKECMSQKQHPWRPLTTPDDPWRPLTTPDDPWRPLTTPDDPWRPLTAPDGPWRPLTTPDDPWRLLTTLTDCHRRSLSVLTPLSLTFVRVLNVLVCRVDGREISTIYPTYSVERIALWGRRG